MLVGNRRYDLEDESTRNNDICLGAQSFEHANVLSEKINFSALGGPGVAIFGPDDLHPIYFDVIN